MRSSAFYGWMDSLSTKKLLDLAIISNLSMNHNCFEICAATVMNVCFKQAWVHKFTAKKDHLCILNKGMHDTKHKNNVCVCVDTLISMRVYTAVCCMNKVRGGKSRHHLWHHLQHTDKYRDKISCNTQTNVPVGWVDWYKTSSLSRRPLLQWWVLSNCKEFRLHSKRLHSNTKTYFLLTVCHYFKLQTMKNALYKDWNTNVMVANSIYNVYWSSAKYQ